MESLETVATFAKEVGDEARALRHKAKAGGLSSDERARLRTLLAGVTMVTRSILLRPDVIRTVGISVRNLG